MTDTVGSELLVSFVEGDTAAFDKLYERYHKLVRVTVRRRTPSYLQAEVNDICQQFWLRLFQYAYTYEPSKSITAWLIAVTSSAVGSYIRKQSPLSSISLVDMERVSSGSDLDLHCSHEKSAEYKAITHEEFGIAMVALRQIPPNLQAVVRAVYLNGHTPTEYAEAIGVSSDAVFGQLRTGLTKLRDVREVRRLRQSRPERRIKASHRITSRRPERVTL